VLVGLCHQFKECISTQIYEACPSSRVSR
jgi:hypothetical protein